VVLNAADSDLKVAALLEIQACKRLKKDLTESVGRSTFLLLKRFSLVRDLRTSLTSVSEASKALWAPLYPQARCFLDAHCDHHFDHYLPIGQISDRPTRLSYCQISLLRKELQASHAEFSLSRIPVHNGDL
jgi:hypothetical protein